MAVRSASGISTRAPVPVFAVAGIGARTRVLELRAEDRIELVPTPRHATVLLVAGAVTAELVQAIGRIHDQIPEPRCVVWWGSDDATVLGVAGAIGVPPDDDIVATVTRAHRSLLERVMLSTRPVGPRENPTPWRGVGPHGQGGEGMMGGQPFGRSMAMTGPDIRDGLELDRVTLPVGPALPGVPPGLQLRFELQGDVVQEVAVSLELFSTAIVGGSPIPSTTDVFDVAATTDAPLADLERARARWHLLRVAEGLALHGLGALAGRVARLAVTVEADGAPRVERVRRGLLRMGALWGGTAGVGHISADDAARIGLSGVAARAAGRTTDARSEDAGYRAAGFRVSTRTRGDAHDRWLLRLDEAAAALRLASDAHDATVGPGTGVEDPRADSTVLLEHLPAWLAGAEWGDAIATVASLDVDVEFAVGRSPVAAAVP